MYLQFWRKNVQADSKTRLQTLVVDSSLQNKEKWKSLHIFVKGSWLAYSPSLSSVDFYVWGQLKQFVCCRHSWSLFWRFFRFKKNIFFCSHTFTLLIEKDFGDHRNISNKFVCAFPPEISWIFGKSFPFPFPYFVLSILL